MKLKHKHKLKFVVITVFFFTSNWMIQLYEMNGFSGSNVMSGIQIARATTQYGILGQTAPQLKLKSWIDGNGKKIEPISLNDYRGKVVYLYFFQDW